jgi:class 3 adenylate cyclase
MLINEALSRADPYAGESLSAVLAAVSADLSDGDEPKRPSISPKLPATARDLVESCWNEQPHLRPAIGAICDVLAVIASELLLMPGDSKARTSNESVVEIMAHRRSHAAGANARSLLRSVFPEAVAEALSAGRFVEPQTFPVVTVFFSDIVNFTQLSANFSALKVMHLLDRLYTLFDGLVNEHNLFKVETIGDSYMAVGNLRDDQANEHVARVAAFAIDAVAAAATVLADEEDPSAGTIAIRAGFHCGPVVASVVGRSVPRYCLFGDTVNTASRMETCSEPGQVTLSDDAAALLRLQAPGVELSSRGDVQVKGKAVMQLWWLRRFPRELQTWRHEAAELAPAQL